MKKTLSLLLMLVLAVSLLAGCQKPVVPPEPTDPAKPSAQVVDPTDPAAQGTQAPEVLSEKEREEIIKELDQYFDMEKIANEDEGLFDRLVLSLSSAKSNGMYMAPEMEATADGGYYMKEEPGLPEEGGADVIYNTELSVRIHPSLTLAVESYDGLKVTVNGVSKVKNWVCNLSAEETAQWMIRMKQNMPGYISEWDEVLNTVSKTIKGQKLAMSVINAILVNAMNSYPKVKYAIKAQKARARIDFMLRNGDCKTIYAYWKSYPKKLPDQLEELKVLIDKLEN